MARTKSTTYWCGALEYRYIRGRLDEVGGTRSNAAQLQGGHIPASRRERAKVDMEDRPSHTRRTSEFADSGVRASTVGQSQSAIVGYRSHDRAVGARK